MSITNQGSEAKMIQAAIKNNMEVERLMAIPSNKPLADEIEYLKAQNERLHDKLNRTPGRPNEAWNGSY